MSATNEAEALINEVLRREQVRYTAMTAGDSDSIEALLDDELVYTHSSGFSDSKDEYLARVRSGDFVYGTIEHPVSKTVVDGSVVIVFGEMHTEAVIHGTKKNLHNISIAVWRLADAEPRLVALQTTPLARP